MRLSNSEKLEGTSYETNPAPRQHKVGDKIRANMQMHGGEIVDATMQASFFRCIRHPQTEIELHGAEKSDFKQSYPTFPH